MHRKSNLKKTVGKNLKTFFCTLSRNKLVDELKGFPEDNFSCSTLLVPEM